MTIVNLKHYRDQKANELLKMFKLPCVDYSKGYQVRPSYEAIGGSASTSSSTLNSVEATKLYAVNELRKWTRLEFSSS